MKIYLSGSLYSEIFWKQNLVEGLDKVLESLEDEAVQLEIGNEAKLTQWSGAKTVWPIMQKAIFGMHDYVGPYDKATRHTALHRTAIKASNLVFHWATSAPYVGSFFDLGYAAAMGKYTALCTSNPTLLLAHTAYKGRQIDLGINYTGVYPSASEALTKVLEAAHADPDLMGYRQMASKFSGRCSDCGGSYGPGDIIMWSRDKGSMHIDCYKLRTNDPGISDRLAFNGEIIAALRKRIAELERAEPKVVSPLST